MGHHRKDKQRGPKDDRYYDRTPDGYYQAAGSQQGSQSNYIQHDHTTPRGDGNETLTGLENQMENVSLNDPESPGYTYAPLDRSKHKGKGIHQKEHSSNFANTTGEPSQYPYAGTQQTQNQYGYADTQQTQNQYGYADTQQTSNQYGYADTQQTSNQYGNADTQQAPNQYPYTDTQQAQHVYNYTNTQQGGRGKHKGKGRDDDGASYAAAYTTDLAGGSQVAYTAPSGDTSIEATYDLDTYNDQPYMQAVSNSQATYAAALYGQHSGQAGESSAVAAASYSPDVTPVYRMEPSWKFRKGEVLKTIRSELKGSKEIPMTNYKEDPKNHFYFGPRRFIVVAEGHGRSTCVPIYTYEHRGCNKKGVKPEEHGIVFSAAHKPHILANEPQLGFHPVPVIMAAGEKLAKESRALYARLENIEHNSPVRFIGTVEPESFWIVEGAVNDCWDQNTKRKAHHHSDRKDHHHRSGKHGKK